jgi:phenylacetate-CoA ligase
VSAVLTLVGAARRYRQLLRSQYWSAAEIRSYVASHLDQTLRVAAQIPFYAARFGGTPRSGDLRSLPVLQRREIDELNKSVLSRYPNGLRFSSDTSSGSTGMPAEFIFDASHQHGRLAARARYLRAHGWTPLKRNVWLIYAVFRTARSDDEQLMQSRVLMKTGFLSPAPDLEGQVARLVRIDPVFLYTCPSYLEVLLHRLGESGGKLPSLRKIFSGAEVLEDSLRERTRELLGVEIAQNYGSTEAFMAWECPRGSLHVNAEHVFVEIVDQHGREAVPGEIGKVLVTTLENRLAPLVRYEIGDYAIAGDGRCRCGRNLPLISRVIGRGMNLFRLRDGRRVSPWHLATAVRQRPELKQFQIVQRSVEHYTVRFVSDSSLTTDGEEAIRAGFRKILGASVSVNFEKVNVIPRTFGGKYMTALSELAD